MNRLVFALSPDVFCTSILLDVKDVLHHSCSAMPHDESAILLQLFLIFTSAKILGKVFERLRLSLVLGEVIAGVALGPYVLGWVRATDAINSMAQLGAIFLLFSVGLEMYPEELIKTGKKAISIAVAGIVASFVLVFAYLSASGSGKKTACIIGAALVSTSIGISARVLRELKVIETRAAKIILGAAVFDDILGMVLLAVIVELVGDQRVHWLRLGILLSEAVGFALFMIFFAPRLVRRAQPAVQGLSISNAPLIIALVVCLGLSVATTWIGLAGIIGAFFAGLALAEFSNQWQLGTRFTDINEFLSPFFFFAMGAQLNLSLLGNIRVLIAAIVISALAVAAKIAGCGLPLLPEGWRTALQVGVGMVPRGEVTLVVVLIGIRMNLISPDFYAVLLFVVAISMLLTPPVLAMLFRSQLEPVKKAAAHA